MNPVPRSGSLVTVNVMLPPVFGALPPGAPLALHCRIAPGVPAAHPSTGVQATGALSRCLPLGCGLLPYPPGSYIFP